MKSHSKIFLLFEFEYNLLRTLKKIVLNELITFVVKLIGYLY